MTAAYGDISWERMIRAVEKVRERLTRTVRILTEAGVPYCVVGGNAVAEAAVRNTQDVDILLRRSDLPAAINALEAHGFVYRHAGGIDMFLDGPGAKARDAVHVVFANEKVRAEYDAAAPDVAECDDQGVFTVLSLEALVRMKLTSYRLKDRVHLLDFIDVGLLDESWPKKYPAALAERLQQLLDHPDG